MRVADEDRQLSAAEIRKLILDQYPQAQQWDNQPLNLPIKALNSAKVKAFAKQAGLVWSSLGTNDTQRMQQALTKLEVQEDGQLLNAAKLFLPICPFRCDALSLQAPPAPSSSTDTTLTVTSSA